jgi:ketosteroid isomerase-like protein
MTDHDNAAAVRAAYEAMQRGDMATMAGFIDEDVVWHESTPGFEGDYQGRDEVLAMMGRIFEEAGVQIQSMTIHDVLANDEHAVILHEGTMSRGDRTHSARYVDVYHVRDGRATEHWHLAVDPAAEVRFFAD